MARVELAPALAADLQRILAHLLEHEAADAGARIQEVVEALDVLQHNPCIGRPVRAELRELVIGRRARGYVALYRYVAALDTVFVLALRAQNEVGCRE